jgi:hypothetical protein
LIIDKNTGEPTIKSLDGLKKALSERAGHNTKTELTCDKNIDQKKVNKYAQSFAKK